MILAGVRLQDIHAVATGPKLAGNFVGWARFWGLLPKKCISEKTSWSWKISHFVTPAQKPCRGDGYGNLSAGQKLSGMVFMVRTIAYGAQTDTLY